MKETRNKFKALYENFERVHTRMLSITITLVILGQLVSANDRDVSTLTSASAEFSQRLYQKIAVNESNVVYSPYSIHSILTMTSMGAGGDTLIEMRNALGLKSMADDSVHVTYKKIIEQLNDVADVQLQTGNSIVPFNTNHSIQPKLIEEASMNYHAKDDIDWDADSGIVAVLDQKDIQPNVNFLDYATIMGLVNTLSFNGTWDRQFDKEETNDTNFHHSEDSVMTVQMMHDDRIVKIKRDNANGVDVAELPFKGGRFSLYIALPQKVGGISELEDLLARPGRAQDLFTNLSSVYVQLAIPKFRIETEQYLADALKDLGIVSAFDPNTANFSGIYEHGDLYIKDILYRTVIEVQETGTAAAAATGVNLVKETVPRESFIADHPFVHFLRDNETGQILFQGKFSG
ncbi:hypothetical protein Btru_002504 [Bulinus truncatus]|nr:hypothetical protein Btru_002504 [Bulinus truncatus]